MSTLKNLKSLKEENYRYLNANSGDKEEHQIFNKATKSVVSVHPSRGAAYNELSNKYKFDHNLTVRHNGSN